MMRDVLAVLRFHDRHRPRTRRLNVADYFVEVLVLGAPTLGLGFPGFGEPRLLALVRLRLLLRLVRLDRFFRLVLGPGCGVLLYVFEVFQLRRFRIRGW